MSEFCEKQCPWVQDWDQVAELNNGMMGASMNDSTELSKQAVQAYADSLAGNDERLGELLAGIQESGSQALDRIRDREMKQSLARAAEYANRKQEIVSGCSDGAVRKLGRTICGSSTVSLSQRLRRPLNS